jgi:Putative exonuclease, RdgC
MGILANTVSICHFRIIGNVPADDIFTWMAEHLQQHAFRSIDATLEEQAVGWVHLTDHRATDFCSPADFWHDGYAAFTLRIDQRKIPAALTKSYQRAAEEDFLVAQPTLQRVPKQKREDLRDAVRLALLSKTLPVPSTVDLLWNTRDNILTITSLSTKNIDLVDAHIKRTFPDLRLVALHPMARAARACKPELLPALEKANQAGSEAILDQIRANLWLGQDLLLWLLYRTLNDSGEYHVTQSGPIDHATQFVAYLNDRLVLMHASESGMQKVTVAGAQDHFGEVLAALRGGKCITEAAITLEQAENQWRLTLKGELFHFASLKAPSVRVEKDDCVDAHAEQEAVFYERMHLLESGLQMFDSLLQQFIEERLNDSWALTKSSIDAWIMGSQTK